MSRSCISNARAPTIGAMPPWRFRMIAEAKARGLDVDCDAYPYDAGSNPLKNLLPQWVQAGGFEAMIARLDELADIARKNSRRYCTRRAQQLGPHSVLGLRAQSRFRRTCRSMPAGPSRRSPPSAASIRSTRCAIISIEDQGATRVLVTSISEDDIRTLVASPLALVGSDGNCVAPYGTVGQGMPHPRFYGTFPRILSRYVRDESALPLELAIHKMTGATARALQSEGPRAFAGRLLRRRRRSSIRRISSIAPLTPIRTNFRAARAPPSSSMARWWSITQPIPARCLAWCCAATIRRGELGARQKLIQINIRPAPVWEKAGMDSRVILVSKHQCPVCGRPMRVSSTVPRLGSMPALRSFECKSCGVIITEAATGDGAPQGAEGT